MGRESSECFHQNKSESRATFCSVESKSKRIVQNLNKTRDGDKYNP
jgi:hypothetical protein